ncbi:hypothetical protein [Streptomyces silvisoli]|uniref:Transposase n=1 Tax=Streptomyces silvisoli TaxID=3034235 RepID=A0ABT5ZKB6_9ACTN|nr:hypothetical protein [Streptomyces silvisoli]MDF3290270.1 hypothetical protein [Streptomyces silvisoli]
MIAAHFPVTPADLSVLFLREFRQLVEEKGQDWRTVPRADAAFAPGRVKVGLATFVRVVWQRVADDLAARSAEPRSVLSLHDAGLIARYWDEGERTFLVTLQAAPPLTVGRAALSVAPVPDGFPHPGPASGRKAGRGTAQ